MEMLHIDLQGRHDSTVLLGAHHTRLIPGHIQRRDADQNGGQRGQGLLMRFQPTEHQPFTVVRFNERADATKSGR